jgi:hypothetical protein
MTRIDEDYEAWEKFPEHRWIFNKLELSLKLGYNCGPACVPVRNTGNYVVRPIYNLYGMGVGAHRLFLRGSEDRDDMTKHKFIPPGHFWCEWFEGNHYSIDYRWSDEGKGGIHSHWEPICTTIGEQDGDLEKFTSWKKVINHHHVLPFWLYDFAGCKELNIEYINDNILEVHLRTGNDVVHDDPVGTEIKPVWQSDTKYNKLQQGAIDSDGWQYFDNSADGELYDASGYIKDPRVGYLKRCKL